MNVGRQLKLVIGTGIILSLLSGASALAIAREDGLPAESNSQEAQTLLTRPNAARTTLAERLAARKEALGNALTTVQTNRLRARCQAAQAKLSAVNDRAILASGNRATAYKNIQTNLTALVSKLEGKVDTTDLEAALTTLGEKITAFEADANTYKQTLADLLELDCTADPTAFRASLEAAKTEQTQLKEKSQDIRAYIQETIKPILQTIRASLAGEAN